MKAVQFVEDLKVRVSVCGECALDVELSDEFPGSWAPFGGISDKASEGRPRLKQKICAKDPRRRTTPHTARTIPVTKMMLTELPGEVLHVCEQFIHGKGSQVVIAFGGSVFRPSINTQV